jgi:hypothetical protein
MTALLIGLPIMLFAAILQSSVISSLNLISGSADIIILVIIAWTINERVRNAWIWAALGILFTSVFSSMPFFVYLFSYGSVFWISDLFHRKIWQAPLLIMLGVSLVGTFLEQGLAMLALQLNGIAFSFSKAFSQIFLPSLLLNLLLAIPVFAVFHYLAKKVYSEKMEE